MIDSEFQPLSTVQNEQMPTPVTIASTTTIAPTTRMSMITGTVAIATVTPPVDGHHELVLVFTTTTPTTTVTTGNIINAVTPTQNVPVLLNYNPITAKYYAK